MSAKGQKWTSARASAVSAKGHSGVSAALSTRYERAAVGRIEHASLRHKLKQISERFLPCCKARRGLPAARFITGRESSAYARYGLSDRVARADVTSGP